jgi:Large polyvalent protein associated domain 29
MKIIEVKDCAKMLRGALKQGFPNTTFSVKMSRYSMGHSIDVRWTDGPTATQVKAILDRYESKGFDGMTDCSYSCGKRLLCGQIVNLDAGYVHGSRNESRALRAKVADRLAYECGLGPVALNQYDAVTEDVHVPFQFHSHWHEGKFITIDQLEADGFILAGDSHVGEWFSRLLNKVAGDVSLEDQQPIDPNLLPEYIDIDANASTGRAAFEDPMKMFEGHSVNAVIK